MNTAVANREAVEDLLTTAAHRLDDGEFARWAGLFTADALYEITTRENVAAGYPLGLMRCTGQRMLQDRIEALRSANIYEDHVYTHLLGRPLAPDAGNPFDVRSNFAIYRTLQGGSTEVFACGRYLDRLVAQDGALKFASRRVILDSRRIDTLLVYPL